MDTDRNLLFAVLALQAGLIDRNRFILACTLWATRKDVPIAELLVEQGWLAPAARGAVEQLLQLQVAQHDGDARASLAAAPGVEARAALASVADDDVERSVAALTTPEVRPDPLASAAEDFSTAPSGNCAGRNILYEEIGHGGIGRVLRGRDPELRRDLAVKVLHDEYRDDANVQRRFVEEAQIGGQLQHPGVVPVYELGQFPDRRPYFTMKLVKGHTLADLLKNRPNVVHDQARFLAIFEQVCQAVAYAHSKGVIHRDLKPANVMVGTFAEVQVMDWGLAKVLKGESERDPEATTAGTVIRTVRTEWSKQQDGRTGVVGTPAYMAPEQARGELEAVDERADVFGLGAILCVILTGRPLYIGGDPGEVLRRAAAGEVGEAFGRFDGCGADAKLVALAKACLSPRFADRPRDAARVAARIAAYQAAVQQRLRAAEMQRAAAEARAVEERKRRRVSLALAAAVLALVAMGAGGGLLVQHQADERRVVQARQHQAFEFALEKASTLGQQGHWVEALTVLEQARRVLGDTGSDDLCHRLDVAQDELELVNQLDGIRQRRATMVKGAWFNYAPARRDYEAAFRKAGLGKIGDDAEGVAARVRASGVAGHLVAALDDWAYIAREAKDKSWLLAVARSAAPDPWGDRFRDLAVWNNPQELQALADDALRDDGAKLSQLSPQLLTALGRRLDDRVGAVPLLRAAQRRYPSDFWLNYFLGWTLATAKQSEEAACYYRVAVALRPDAGVAHAGLGYALHDQKELAGAIAEFKKAIELDPKFAIAHSALGQALITQGHFAEGRTATRRSLELLPEGAPLRTAALEQLRLCERLVALDENLPAVLNGEVEPTDAAERLDLGHFCQLYKLRHAAAARFYADAFAADPKLAADLQQQHRYNAACNAALASEGHAEGAKNLPDKVQLMLRRQALGWLRADLALYAKLAERAEPAAKQAVRQPLAHWQEDTDLASVRDKAALDKLPDDERKEWRQLWDDVAALLKKVEEKK
jgi:serine/threonine-protein kinase